MIDEDDICRFVVIARGEETGVDLVQREFVEDNTFEASDLLTIVAPEIKWLMFGSKRTTKEPR